MHLENQLLHCQISESNLVADASADRYRRWERWDAWFINKCTTWRWRSSAAPFFRLVTYSTEACVQSQHRYDNNSLIFSLSLQSSAVEQVLDILMDILSWEIAEVVSPCLPRGLWSHIVIRVLLLLGTVCPRHPPYPVLPSCPFSRAAFPYPQPGDTGGRRSAPAVCQSLTSADPTDEINHIQVSRLARS